MAKHITCPLCGRPVLITYGTDIWGGLGGVLLAHCVPDRGYAPCLGSRMSPPDAEGVGRILREDGERLRLAAHP